MAGLQDLSLCAAGNNSKKLDLSLEYLLHAGPNIDALGHKLVEVDTILLHVFRN